jgi:hypothetical protein
MAIDSADKRKSVPWGITGIPGLANTAPIPDGDLDDDQDRMHIAGFYRGIEPGTEVAVAERKKGLLRGVYN